MEYYMPEPPKNNSNGFSIIILLAIIAFLLYSLEACLSNPKHYCNWVDCEYQGEVISKKQLERKFKRELKQLLQHKLQLKKHIH